MFGKEEEEPNPCLLRTRPRPVVDIVVEVETEDDDGSGEWKAGITREEEVEEGGKVGCALCPLVFGAAVPAPNTKGGETEEEDGSGCCGPAWEGTKPAGPLPFVVGGGA
jgi:hypothetical protein